MTEVDASTGWLPEVQEIQERQRLAAEMGGEESVARHHAAGKLTVRERFDRLLDPGSFQEIGSLAGRVEEQDGVRTSYRPANFVGGMGTIGGRWVVVGGEDFTLRGGASDAAVGNKGGFSDRLAAEWRLPLIRLIDGAGASVRSLEQMGRTYLPVNPGFTTVAKLLGIVPVVSAAMGSVAGYPAAKAVAAHWTIIVKGQGQIFPAGPPVVRRALGIDIHKEDLGGYKVHAYKSGVADNVAEDEEDCFLQIQRFLSYLPGNVWQAPPRAEPTDDPNRREEALLSLVPRNRNRPYNVRKMLNLIMDRDSLFEIAPFYGRSLVTSFARLDGYPVGILASDPMHQGGAMDATSSEKLMRFVDMCDTFHLPVVNFVDQPGFMIGPAGEEAGTIRKGVRALCAVEESTVPWMAVIIRKSYGVAGAGHTRAEKLLFRYAWPSAEWGSLPIEGGVDAAYRREIAASPDPDARRRELEARLTVMRSPFKAAEAFNVEELIDPRETRPLLCRFVGIAQDRIHAELGPKYRMGMRP
jgi:acetyl-CoA carboxylase carboxyltransferase component